MAQTNVNILGISFKTKITILLKGLNETISCDTMQIYQATDTSICAILGI